MSYESNAITVTGTAQRQAWLDRVLPKVERVRPGLWSIPTVFPNNPLRYVLSYALDYQDGVALVDTGWPCEDAWDGLVAGLAEAGWDLSDVRAVLVTHGHADHYGLARRIRERTGAWIAMHEADARLEERFTGPRTFLQANDEWLIRRGAAAMDRSAARLPTSTMFADFRARPDRYLEDGGQPLGSSVGLTAIWTPGHTPGHTCFFDQERNLMLTGDHVLPRITPNISPPPGVEDDILGDYLESLQLLAGYADVEVLPAHEYRFVGLAQRVRDLRRHHGVRLAEVIEVLRAQPGATTLTVTEGLHLSRPWDQMQAMIRFALGEAYSHLVHLERTGYIANKGVDVDSWYLIREGVPDLG